MLDFRMLTVPSCGRLWRLFLLALMTEVSSGIAAFALITVGQCYRVVIVCFTYPFQFATGLLPCLCRALIRRPAIRCEEHITYCLVTRHVRWAFIGPNDKKVASCPLLPKLTLDMPLR